mmetsp:Transcript_19140/g.49746  ORF Transcript_19140/g.49746 Transcript_19140/m.49746 type:complete len:881 (+) Transcript_19140:170-2812(+)
MLFQSVGTSTLGADAHLCLPLTTRSLFHKAHSKTYYVSFVMMAVLWVSVIHMGIDITLQGMHRFWADESLPQACLQDNEGQWSIGIFKGPSPFALKPLEELGNSSPQAVGQKGFTVANPALTCAQVSDVPASFVADPFLWPMQDGSGLMYMFHEVKSLFHKRGVIGAAVSKDGGLTFQHLGVVLEEPWHLSYPHVFNHSGQMYMLPEGSTSRSLRLYRATNFPLGWQAERVLINQPLIDASLLQPQPGGDGRWYLFASNRNQKSSKNCRELEIWSSSSLKGQWQPHPGNPVRSWRQASRMAGPPIVHNGHVYRFAQDCAYTYGHKVRSFQVTTLNATHYEEVEVPLGFEPAGLQGEAAWNGVRQHHLDAHTLPDGSWVAAMDGDRYVSDYLTFKWLDRFLMLLPFSLLLGLGSLCTLLFGRSKGSSTHLACGSPRVGLRGYFSCFGPASSALLCVPRLLHRRVGGRHGSSMTGNAAQSLDAAAPGTGTRSPQSDADDAKDQYRKSHLPRTMKDACNSLLQGKKAAAGVRKKGGSASAHSMGALAAVSAISGSLSRRHFLGMTIRRWLSMACLAALGTLLLTFILWAFFKAEVMMFVMFYIKAFGGQANPIPIDGHFSKFSLLVMSFDARELPLKAFISHYSQCSSVGEIVVVWNKGVPPLPQSFDSQVPVRVRVEPVNSMNNRFKPDPDLKHRGVLLLDDDILMSCADIEFGFAKWRQHPERITGFYARLLEGDVPNYRCTHCEMHTYSMGHYNIVLAGASFLDSNLVFQSYSAPENKLGREYVDRVFNCDDLLVNYLMASKLGTDTQHAQWVRPHKRVDVGRLTSTRLSGAHNVEPVRHQCTEDFAALFGNPLKNRSYPLDFMGLQRPVCLGYLGCMYI